jgi:hypothetical protein
MGGQEIRIAGKGGVAFFNGLIQLAFVNVERGKLYMQGRVFVLVTDRCFEILNGLIDLSVFKFELRQEEIVIGGRVGRGGLDLGLLGLLNGDRPWLLRFLYVSTRPEERERNKQGERERNPERHILIHNTVSDRSQ